MNWRELEEEYGEHPDEHYDDPADYQQSIGNTYQGEAEKGRGWGGE